MEKFQNQDQCQKKNLKYKIGERVECLTDEWEKGVIAKLWYREELWETGKYVPYQVLLDDGNLIWVPRDSEIFIRSVKNNEVETNISNSKENSISY